MMILMIRVILSEGLYLKAFQDKKKSMATAAAVFPRTIFMHMALVLTLHHLEQNGTGEPKDSWFKMVHDS